MDMSLLSTWSRRTLVSGRRWIMCAEASRLVDEVFTSQGRLHGSELEPLKAGRRPANEGLIVV